MEAAQVSVADLWKIASERLQRRNIHFFNDWFRKMTPVRMEDNGCTLIIGVADAHFAELVLEYYSDFIGDALAGIDGKTYSFAFEAGHKVTPPPRVEVPREPVYRAEPEPRAREEEEETENPFTFDNFVVSEENRHAYMSVRAAVESPGLYNPLYIYGASGVGKSHLLHAAAQSARVSSQKLRVRYTSCSELLDNFYELLQNKHDMGEFRSSMRDVDVLLVDDVHVLAGKTQLMEEFFKVFNYLFSRQKQIILTSDKQPCEIKGLETRLVTRFESGMTAEIAVPEVEGRLTILRMMREQTMLQVRLGDSVLEFLAQQISSSVRRLKGAFIRLASFASIHGSQLTVQQAEELLAVQLAQESSAKTVPIELIQRKVAERFNLSVADILGSKRPKNIAEPRMIAMYLARRLTKHSLPEIGSAFGKTHATIINALNKVPQLCQQDDALRRTVQQLEIQLKKG